jgi:hypothetical protein
MGPHLPGHGRWGLRPLRQYFTAWFVALYFPQEVYREFLCVCVIETNSVQFIKDNFKEKEQHNDFHVLITLLQWSINFYLIC